MSKEKNKQECQCDECVNEESKQETATGNKSCDCGCASHKEHSKETKNQVEHERDTYLEALKQTMADFDNYRKRNASIASKSHDDGIFEAILAILPSVDALDKAFEMCKENKQVLEGLILIKDNILAGFKKLGLTEIDALNKEFDPNFHNAVVATEEKDMASGIVLEEYQKGYKLGDKIVRYTMCRVSK